MEAFGIRRWYLNVNGRQVLVRTAGQGPLLLLLHDLPGTSETLAQTIAACAAHGLVVAVDLPGHGTSDPLGPDAGAADVAELLWGSVRHWTAQPIHVAGVGLGALAALAVAEAKPTRTATLTLVGAPLEPVRRHALRSCGFPYYPPRIDGGHLLEVWSRIRRGALYDPWFATDAASRLETAQPEVHLLHLAALDVIRGGPEHGRLPQLLLGLDAEHIVAALGDLLPVTSLPAGIAAGELERKLIALLQSDQAPAVPERAKPPRLEVGPGVRRNLVDTFAGQMHVRLSGDQARPPVLLLHQSPGSAVSLAAVARAFAADRFVIAPDTLGNGDSDRPTDEPVLDLSFYADVLATTLDGLGVERADVLGSHTGAMIGLELAIRHPDRVRALGLDGITLFPHRATVEILARYFPSLAPDVHGLHLVRAWHLRLDMRAAFPWFEPSSAAITPNALPSAEAFHPHVVDLLTSGETWDRSYRAAFSYPTARSLPLLRRPTLLGTGPGDVLGRFSKPARDLNPRIQVADHAGLTTADAVQATADQYRRFFDQQV